MNAFGFVETPYRKVEKGHVTDQIDYLTADEEDRYVIAQANAKLDAKNKFAEERVLARRAARRSRHGTGGVIHYMDVSPRQMVSVATAMIPFLEHDDASRALMGSNMQRQAVPLIQLGGTIRGHRDGIPRCGGCRRCHCRDCGWCGHSGQR